MSARSIIYYDKGRVALNIGAGVGEFIGTYFFVLGGLGVHVATGANPLGTGTGFGFTALFLTYVLLVRSGSLFNTGITLGKALGWVPGLQFRNYFGRATLWKDFVAWFLFTGLQLAAAVLAVLTLRAVDNSGLLSATTVTVPNGNLAGDDGGALLLLWLLNTILVWVHLHVTGPRAGIVIEQLGAPVAMGATYFAVTIVSVYWGTGSTCNFALDLALATLIGTNSANKLWLSAVGQVLGALTALLVVWGGTVLDHILSLKVASGAQNYDHQRINSLAPIIVRTADEACSTMLSGDDGILLDAHNTVTDDGAAAAGAAAGGRAKAVVVMTPNGMASSNAQYAYANMAAGQGSVSF